jgi:hypothetical protein
MADELYQCRKSGVAGKEAELPDRFLPKILLKTKPKAYLKRT